MWVTMQWSAVVSLLPYHHKNAAVLLILLQNWIHSYQNWVNCQKHTGCLCKIILKTNCCGSTGKWKKAMEHLTPRYPIAVAETLDDFSTITAIVFRFPNAISYLETYLLDHISLQKKNHKKRCHSMTCPTLFSAIYEYKWQETWQLCWQNYIF